MQLVDRLQSRLRKIVGQVAASPLRPKVLSLEGLQPLVLGNCTSNFSVCLFVHVLPVLSRCPSTNSAIISAWDLAAANSMLCFLPALEMLEGSLHMDLQGFLITCHCDHSSVIPGLLPCNATSLLASCMPCLRCLLSLYGTARWVTQLYCAQTHVLSRTSCMHLYFQTYTYPYISILVTKFA